MKVSLYNVFDNNYNITNYIKFKYMNALHASFRLFEASIFFRITTF